MTEYHKNSEGDYLIDERGEKIPISICICHAWEPNECICGAWDNVTDWYDD